MKDCRYVILVSDKGEPQKKESVEGFLSHNNITDPRKKPLDPSS